MQSNFLFFDTETTSTNEGNEQTLNLKLGWAYHWNKEYNTLDKKYFENKKDFWDFVEWAYYPKNQDISELNESDNYKTLFVYAHNTEFDMKIVDGYNELIKRGWSIDNLYIKGCVYILSLRKETMMMHIWDTMNYYPASLEKIGESLKIPKMKIDFNTCTNEQLRVYCENDVRIIYEYIKALIEFLETNDLTMLKPTAGAISMNAFKHRFYDVDKNPIYIHNESDIMKLERESYRGGITDCFYIGKTKEHLHKLDVNSMYPWVMRNYEVPVKFFYRGKSIKELINNNGKYHMIADIKYSLPDEYALILARFKLGDEIKNGFIRGVNRATLTTPEIEFIIKHGKILKHYSSAYYHKSNQFKDYIDFLYESRLKFKDEKNDIFGLFCKILMNSNYGKWGQKASSYNLIKDDAENNMIRKLSKDELANYEIYDSNGSSSYMKLGDKIFHIKESEENSYNSFVAISSIITAYARMYLVELMLKAGKQNLYYADTDSLIVNEIGFKNLSGYLDNKKLGMLKDEGTSDDSEFIRPKYYVFDDEFKCKGVRKDHKIISEDDKQLVISQEQFMRFSSSMKHNQMNSQKITRITKTLNKTYDKAKVDNNRAVSYTNADLKCLA
jgi:hypothetical protein